jgi:hypothetical protein
LIALIQPQIAINIDINWVWFFWDQKKLFSEVGIHTTSPTKCLGHTAMLVHTLGGHAGTLLEVGGAYRHWHMLGPRVQQGAACGASLAVWLALLLVFC